MGKEEGLYVGPTACLTDMPGLFSGLFTKHIHWTQKTSLLLQVPQAGNAGLVAAEVMSLQTYMMSTQNTLQLKVIGHF
jgi:hypothetical protein